MMIITANCTFQCVCLDVNFNLAIKCRAGATILRASCEKLLWGVYFNFLAVKYRHLTKLRNLIQIISFYFNIHLILFYIFRVLFRLTILLL